MPVEDLDLKRARERARSGANHEIETACVMSSALSSAMSRSVVISMHRPMLTPSPACVLFMVRRTSLRRSGVHQYSPGSTCDIMSASTHQKCTTGLDQPRHAFCYVYTWSPEACTANAEHAAGRDAAARTPLTALVIHSRRLHTPVYVISLS